MKMQEKYRIGILNFWIGILIITIAGPVFGQALVKVHKDKITISAPNQQGIIHVQGQPGAIETTSPIKSLLVRNLTTNEKVLVLRLSDGSFHAEILGEAGHRLRVEARNQEDKRSIGTFDVPVTTGPAQPYAGWQTVREVPAQPPLATESPARPTPRKGGARNLAVMIMVIDMGRGEIVAAERFVGVPRSNLPGEQLYPFTAQNIIHKCIDAIRTELKPTVGLGSYERKTPSRNQRPPLEKKPSPDKSIPSAPEKQKTLNPEKPPAENANPPQKEKEKKEIEN